MRTIVSSTLAITFLFTGLLSVAPMPAAAQVDDVSDLVTQEDLEDAMAWDRRGLARDGWSLAENESTADELFLDWTFTHEDHGCSLRYLVGFGDNAQDRLDTALDEWRTREGASVQTVEHDFATEYRFVTQGDTMGRGGRWNHLAEAKWTDPSGSDCSTSTLESVEWGGDDLLEDMAEHLQMPAHQFLLSLLPDSMWGEARSEVKMESLEKPGAPETPLVRASYGRGLQVGVAYGDAAQQLIQSLVRGRFRTPPMTARPHKGRTFYVGEDSGSETTSYVADPVAFRIEAAQASRSSEEPSEPKENQHSGSTLPEELINGLDLSNQEPIQPPSWLYDEASVRAFWRTTSRYDRAPFRYDEDAPDLLPNDAPDGFSYRFAGLGSVSIALPLPPDWSTITPSGFRTQSLAFVRSANGFDMDGQIKISSSSSISLQSDDNVIIQALAPGRRGNGPDPASMIEDLVAQAPLQEATVTQQPADTTLSGFDAVRATVRGKDADGRPARYRMFGVSVDGTTLMLAVLRPEEADANTKEIIQTVLNNLDLRTL